jgi:DNA replication factor GINS
MDLEELQAVQSRERQASSLQHLRDSFYQDAGRFVRELHDRRDEAAAAADDPFGSDEVRRLSDDIDTAEHTVEAIYERRIGKIVKMASIAAADMPYDDDGLTEEETRLFEDLVENIERNRELVLSTLDGEAPGLTCDRPDAEATTTAEPTGSGAARSAPETTPAGADGTGTVDAEVGAAGGDPPAPPERSEQGADTGPTFAIGDAMGGDEVVTDPDPDPGTPPETGSEQSAAPTLATGTGDGPDGVERATVRITDDVGDIFGVDGRAYDLTAEDVVTLPEENATVLTEKGQAERLD